MAGYRRRFIVEFGPEDSGLIDRMGVAHRTKRAAIIAGLRLLESGELERLRMQVAGLEADLATAQAAGAAAKPTATATAKLDKAKADLAAERTARPTISVPPTASLPRFVYWTSW